MDVAQLGFDIKADGALVATEALDDMSEAAQRAQNEAQDLSGASVKASNTMAGFGRNANQASRMAGGALTPLRNVSMQLSQVAQQGAVTGNYFQALTLQAADIGLAFGTIGIAVGAAISVLGPMVIQLFDGADGANTFEGALENLGETIDSLEGSFDTINLTMDQLIEKYGEAATRVREFALAQAEIAASRAEQALREQLAITLDVVTGFTTAVDAGRNYRNTLLRIEEAFGVTRDQAIALEDALGALSGAGSFEDQQAQLQSILALLEGMDISLSDIPPELQRALSEMITFSNEVDRAAVLMENLRAAAAGVSVGVPLFEQGFDGAGLLPPVESGGEAGRALVRVARGGGGGGISEAERERNELLREAERIIKSTLTPQEEFNEGVDRLNALLEGGFIEQETYNRALEDLQDELGEATNALRDFGDNVGDELTSAFRSAAEGADVLSSATDAMTNIFLQAAEDMFRQNIADPLSSSLNGFLGNLFGFSAPAAASANVAQTAAKSATNVNVINQAGVQVETQDNGSGLDVILRRVEDVVSKSITSGGAVGSALNKTYQISPAMARR